MRASLKVECPRREIDAGIRRGSWRGDPSTGSQEKGFFPRHCYLLQQGFAGATPPVANTQILFVEKDGL